MERATIYWYGYGRPARCQAVNTRGPTSWKVWILQYLSVRCRKPLWEGSTRVTAAAASWAVTIWTSGTLSSSERDTSHLMKGKCRDDGNSGSDCVYKWQKSSSAHIPLHCLWWQYNRKSSFNHPIKNERRTYHCLSGRRLFICTKVAESR